MIVLEAKLRLIESPQHRSLVCLAYPDTFSAADHVPEILPLNPIGLEGFEGSIVDGLKKKNAPNLELIPEGRGFLLVEFGSNDPAESDANARQLIEQIKASPDPPNIRLYNKVEARHVWKLRESGPRAAAAAPGMPPEWEGWDDAAVPPEKLGNYLRDIRKLLDEYNYHTAFYGHFGHGCIHMRVSFDLQSEQGIRNYGEFVERAADIVVSYGGSLSGEHGDGQSRAALLAQDVRAGIDQGVRRIQIRLGSGQQDESQQGGQRLPAHRESAAGSGLQAERSQNVFSVSGR